jgi:hypothetical protein
MAAGKIDRTGKTKREPGCKRLGNQDKRANGQQKLGDEVDLPASPRQYAET